MESFNFRFSILFLILLATGNVLGVHAQYSCPIQVSVIDSDTNREVKDVQIQVINYDAKRIYYADTDKPGFFQFVNPGRLSIAMKASDYGEDVQIHKTALKCANVTHLKPRIIAAKMFVRKRSENKLGRFVQGKVKTRNTGENQGTVLNGGAIKLAKPAFPMAARAVRASGMVKISVIIDKQGNVVSARAISGHPLLRRVSEEAAAGSMFKVTRLSETPVEVSGIIVYNFSR